LVAEAGVSVLLKFKVTPAIVTDPLVPSAKTGVNSHTAPGEIAIAPPPNTTDVEFGKFTLRSSISPLFMMKQACPIDGMSNTKSGKKILIEKYLYMSIPLFERFSQPHPPLHISISSW